MFNDTRHNWYYPLVWNNSYTANYYTHSMEILQMQVVFQDNNWYVTVSVFVVRYLYPKPFDPIAKWSGYLIYSFS